MSLLDIVRSGVRIANQVTKPLHATVTYQKMVLSADGYGAGLKAGFRRGFGLSLPDGAGGFNRWQNPVCGLCHGQPSGGV